MSNVNQAVRNVETILQGQFDLKTDLEFTPEDIISAYHQYPTKFAQWTVVAAQAKVAADKKKLEVDHQEEFMKKSLMGELDKTVRHKMDEQGEKITEARVTNAIYVHSRFLEEQNKLHLLQDELIELQYQAGLLMAAKDAMIHLKDMLVATGIQLHQEIPNN